MSAGPEYDDVVVRIEHLVDRRYRVHIQAGLDMAKSDFEADVGEMELENFSLKVSTGGRVRKFRSADTSIAERMGERLFHVLFADKEVWGVYTRARGTASDHERGVRLTICLSGAPQLMSYPWEYLHDGDFFLSSSIYSPIVRSIDLASVPPRSPVSLPLHILGMVSMPDAADDLAADQEKEKLQAAVAPLEAQGLVHLRWVASGRLAALEEELAAEPVHVFHYVGHGDFDTDANTGQLMLEGPRGGVAPITGEELAPLFRDTKAMRLAVLNTCEGARTSHLDPFAGVASSLVRSGVPAVIGMQYEISDRAALVFSARLYRELARRSPIDAAVAHARKAIWAAGPDAEFGTPVLFLQSRDGRLFPDPTPTVTDPVATKSPPLKAEPSKKSSAARSKRPADKTTASRVPTRAKLPDTSKRPAPPVEGPIGTAALLMSQVRPGAQQGVVARWKKQVGDTVRKNDVVVVVSADGEEVQLRSPFSGELMECFVAEGESVSVDEPIGRVVQIPRVEGPRGTSAVMMPEFGRNVTRVTVSRWNKQVGERIQKDEPLFEVQTQGNSTQLRSPFEGELMEILIGEGATVPVGTALARIIAIAPAEGSQGTATVTMPSLGHGVTRGTITKWGKQVGQRVSQSDILFEISTEKNTWPFHSPFDGQLVEILVYTGATVSIGAPLARLSTELISAAKQKAKPLSALPKLRDQPTYGVPVVDQEKRLVWLIKPALYDQSSDAGGEDRLMACFQRIYSEHLQSVSFFKQIYTDLRGGGSGTYAGRVPSLV